MQRDGKMVLGSTDVPIAIGHGASVTYGVVRMRWWILFSFCMLSFMQAVTWNFYAPISYAVYDLYGWDDNAIAWVENTANIAMLVSIPITQAAVRKYGNRVPTLACGCMMVVCTWLRCVPSLLSFTGLGTLDPLDWPVYLLAIVSMVFNGASAAWLGFAGPIISSAWFDLKERGMATALVTVMPYIGVSVGFILGPLVVPDTGYRYYGNSSHSDSGSPGSASDFRLENNSLTRLYYVQALACTLICCCLWAYFPSKPPKSPSVSASLADECDDARDSSEGFRQIFCNGGPRATRLWVIAIAFALPCGVYSGWSAVLSINLKTFNIGPTAAGWFGCIMTLSGCAGGVVMGAIADRFAGKMKLCILTCYAFSTLGFAWFALIALGYVPGTRSELYAAGVMGGFFLNCPIPLWYELAIETAYPDIPESTGSSLLSFVVTVVQIVYLAVSFIPGLATSTGWMNILMVAVTPVMALPFAFMRVDYNRLNIDYKAKVTTVDYKQSRVLEQRMLTASPGRDPTGRAGSNGEPSFEVPRSCCDRTGCF